MVTQVVLPRLKAPLKIVPDADGRFSDKAYAVFCAANPALKVERSAEGEIVIVPPPGGESAYRENQVANQLTTWANRDGRGFGFNASVQFILADGAYRSPDAAWVSKQRIAKLTKRQRREFLRLV